MIVFTISKGCCVGDLHFSGYCYVGVKPLLGWNRLCWVMYPVDGMFTSRFLNLLPEVVAACIIGIISPKSSFAIGFVGCKGLRSCSDSFSVDPFPILF